MEKQTIAAAAAGKAARSDPGKAGPAAPPCRTTGQGPRYALLAAVRPSPNPEPSFVVDQARLGAGEVQQVVRSLGGELQMYPLRFQIPAGHRLRLLVRGTEVSGDLGTPEAGRCPATLATWRHGDQLTVSCTVGMSSTGTTIPFPRCRNLESGGMNSCGATSRELLLFVADSNKQQQSFRVPNAWPAALHSDFEHLVAVVGRLERVKARGRG